MPGREESFEGPDTIRELQMGWSGKQLTRTRAVPLKQFRELLGMSSAAPGHGRWQVRGHWKEEDC